MKRVFGFLLLFVVLTSFLSAAPQDFDVSFNQALHDLLPESIKKAGVINAATSAGSPPYTFYADDNKTTVRYSGSMLYSLRSLLRGSYQP